MITLLKDDIPEFRVDSKFDYAVGEIVPCIRLYNWMITDIEGDCVTLKKRVKDD